MSAFLLVFSATSYLFSGCACYVATTRKMPLNFKKVALAWVVLGWPTWLINEIAKEEDENQKCEQEEDRNQENAFSYNVSSEEILHNADLPRREQHPVGAAVAFESNI